MSPKEGEVRPERVRVSRPARVVRREGGSTVASQIDAQTGVGEVYMSSLLRAQLRPALGVLGVLALLGFGLPLLFHLAPGLSRVHVLGLPLPWLLLGVLVYPGLVGLGWFYVRGAERTETDFTDAVERRT